ncbi:MAG: penicillin-binding transpeptidase domain-containing protein [Gammaproteobacteria bacterium]
MKKLILGLSLFVFTTTLFALSKVNLAPYFKNETGCFILYDMNKNKIASLYNANRCSKRLPPQSTFKVALSLMAFDKHIINQHTVFKWRHAHQNANMPQWNHNQTPHSWLTNSVLWVSRSITPSLGRENIEHYLALFHYGNQDFSGDPGKNNALTNAWLESSLKISAYEQLAFMKNLVNDDLPISKSAQKHTKTNLYRETTANGWKLYGKTGSGSSIESKDGKNPKQAIGWFVGFIQKDKQKYVVILNFTDRKSPTTTEYGGLRAKDTTEKILNQMGF